MNYKIIGRYIKNLKFEIPNPKIFFLLEKDISNYKINIDIKSHKFESGFPRQGWLHNTANSYIYIYIYIYISYLYKYINIYIYIYIYIQGDLLVSTLAIISRVLTYLNLLSADPFGSSGVWYRFDVSPPPVVLPLGGSRRWPGFPGGGGANRRLLFGSSDFDDLLDLDF